ncbi:hypothetical protein LA6_003599 [Marinibacterium anthonyi]|nr:hypothetical protein LA6_003599 [Marinibacterium anthonyi]
MSAPQPTPGHAPDAYRPAFLGIGIGLASSALFCLGFATYSVIRWDAALATAAQAPAEQTILAGN